MRYNVEYQKNIAFSLLGMKREGIEMGSFFYEKEPVIVYGFDFLGKEIVRELREHVDVLFVLDREHDEEEFEGIPVLSLDNSKVKDITSCYSSIKLIISVVSDEEKILNDTKQKMPNLEYISLYEIFTSLKVCFDRNFQREQNNNTLELLNRVVNNEKSDANSIVTVGTSYSLVLAMLYIDDWKRSIFVLERFVSPLIANKMKELGLYCLYEATSGEYYDICYALSRYAMRFGMPVYGHDHTKISRAFIANGIQVIEDGILNYDSVYTEPYAIYLDDGRKYCPAGFDPLVENVVLTGLDSVPKELESKAIIINPEEKWNKKSDGEKREIASIMGFDYVALCDEVKKGRDTVFLTQPIFFAGDIIQTLEGQIELYNGILNNYDRSRIIIKPHPQDDIDYRSLFPDTYVMERYFPVQMIDWFGIDVKKIIIAETDDKDSCRNIFKDKYEVDLYVGKEKKEIW